MPGRDILRNIVHRLGGGDVAPDGTRALVPSPGHSLRDRGLSLVLTLEGGVIWHAFNADLLDGDVRRYLGLGERSVSRRASAQEIAAARRERERAQAAEVARKRLFCGGLVRGCVPAGGTIVEAYLERRGVQSPSTPDLLFHPAAPRGYESDRVAPAMVAVVRDVRACPIGLHVTALRADGAGKAGERARLMFGSVTGGAVRLAPIGPRGELAVAEGIETALAFAALDETPTWACLSAIGLERFVVPPAVRHLTIAADGDEAGVRAARALADRARRTCSITLAIPPAGRDWNDELLGRVAA